MNTTFQNHTPVNDIPLLPILNWALFACVLGIWGLCYVYLKNQQHALGEKTRQTERAIAEMVSHNEVLSAQISSLTSHIALQKKLREGFIALAPIKDIHIARLLPAEITGPESETTRTASTQIAGR